MRISQTIVGFRNLRIDFYDLSEASHRFFDLVSFEKDVAQIVVSAIVIAVQLNSLFIHFLSLLIIFVAMLIDKA